ncbi:hypothetical protein B0T13DRAFT_195357 [Neurospora crassa]|nr:hypothetical protein B0T13DRAFT_195357 [Neurospora crassa]
MIPCIVPSQFVPLCLSNYLFSLFLFFLSLSGLDSDKTSHGKVDFRLHPFSFLFATPCLLGSRGMKTRSSWFSGHQRHNKTGMERVAPTQGDTKLFPVGRCGCAVRGLANLDMRGEIICAKICCQDEEYVEEGRHRHHNIVSTPWTFKFGASPTPS